MHEPDMQATAQLWHRLGMQVRLALYPDDLRLVAQYLSCGEALVARNRRSSWCVHEGMLSLLLTTAYDALLPIVWRLTCLDACIRPMSALGALVCDDDTATRLGVLALRLASFSYNAADPECTPCTIPAVSNTATCLPQGSMVPAGHGLLLMRRHPVTLQPAAHDSMTRPLRQLHQRWEQLQIDVRCALHGNEPECIRHYLLGGSKLARLGVFDEVGVQLHMTQTLLRAARDPELPRFWRSACIEYTSCPLQRLRELLSVTDPRDMCAIEQAVQTCQYCLPVPPQEGSHGG